MDDAVRLAHVGDRHGGAAALLVGTGDLVAVLLGLQHAAADGLDRMRTLVVGLATVRSEFNVNYGLVMAGSMLTVLPLLVLYIAFQPYFVEGLRLGYGK